MDDELREQVHISKEFLEYAHGAAVRYGNPDKARAYYDSITLVEDALEENWDPDRPATSGDSMFYELVQESRDARDEGLEAATLHEQSMAELRERYKPTLLDRLMSRLPIA